MDFPDLTAFPLLSQYIPVSVHFALMFLRLGAVSGLVRRNHRKVVFAFKGHIWISR